MGLILGTFKIKINYDTKYNQLIKTRIHKSILISVMSNSLWPMDCSTQGFPVHHQLVEIAQTHVHRLSDAIQPTILSSVVPFSSCLQSFPASGSFLMSQLFASGGQSIGASASSISLSSEYSGLISFKIDLFDLLAVQGTLKSLLQCHSSKASILWYSAFFMIQLSHPYVILEKP